ncbi:MAG: hypothetical protein ACLFTR_02855 [Candidatus Woesearchaeota archaeon]
MERKAQSAMEFLMTYGWAFIVCILVVVALYSFGVVDFLSWLPGYCRFDGGRINCEAYVLNSDTNETSDHSTDDGYVLLRLENMLDETIVVTDCRAYVDGEPFCVDDEGKTIYSTEGGKDDFLDCENTEWSESSLMNLRLNDCEYKSMSLRPGTKRRVSIELEYYPRRHGEAFTQTIEGDVFTNIG